MLSQLRCQPAAVSFRLPVPGDSVPGSVLDHARLLVEDCGIAHRAAVAAGNGDLHVEVAAGDHPREQLERAGGVGVWWGEGQLDEVVLD